MSGAKNRVTNSIPKLIRNQKLVDYGLDINRQLLSRIYKDNLKPIESQPSWMKKCLKEAHLAIANPKLNKFLLDNLDILTKEHRKSAKDKNDLSALINNELKISVFLFEEFGLSFKTIELLASLLKTGKPGKSYYGNIMVTSRVHKIAIPSDMPEWHYKVYSGDKSALGNIQIHAPMDVKPTELKEFIDCYWPYIKKLQPLEMNLKTKRTHLDKYTNTLELKLAGYSDADISKILGIESKQIERYSKTAMLNSKYFTDDLNNIEVNWAGLSKRIHTYRDTDN